MSSALRVLLFASITASTPLASAQLVYDISDDGHEIAFPDLIAPESSMPRGVQVPYGNEPDQVIMLRRQVGGIQVADMNNDGLDDVVVGCYISTSNPPYTDWRDMIFYNIGNGQIESTPSWISTNQDHTGDVQVGDINNDGYLDLVTIHGGSLTPASVRAYLGTPTGPHQTADYVSNTPVPGWGTSGLLLDIDHDGDLDLVTTNQGQGASDPYRPIYIWLNSAGMFIDVPYWQSTEQSIQSGLAAGDYDGDGWEDIAVAKWNGWRSAIYKNNHSVVNQTPVWTEPDTDTDKGAVFADFDGNGWPDVAFGGDPATMYANNAGASFSLMWTSMAPAQGPQDFRAVDVDNDGDPDLAEIHFSTGRIYIYLNQDGVVDNFPTWGYDAPEVGTALAFGDLNGDQYPDMVAGFSGDTCLRIFLAMDLGCPVDIAEPFGQLDFSDVVGFLIAFGQQDPAADLAQPFGQIDFSDIVAFLVQFDAGCP
ncbi:MAG: VCBS repeat-containing protein [Phycisphaerales bacterium]